MAESPSRLHKHGRVFFLRHMEPNRVFPGPPFPPRNQGQDAWGAWPGIFGPDALPCRIRHSPARLFLQTVYSSKICGAWKSLRARWYILWWRCWFWWGCLSQGGVWYMRRYRCLGHNVIYHREHISIHLYAFPYRYIAFKFFVCTYVANWGTLRSGIVLTEGSMLYNTYAHIFKILFSSALQLYIAHWPPSQSSLSCFWREKSGYLQWKTLPPCDACRHAPPP